MISRLVKNLQRALTVELCRMCNGTGRVRSTVGSGDRVVQFYHDCSYCGGRGAYPRYMDRTA